MEVRNVRVVCPYCGENVFPEIPLSPGFGSYVVRCGVDRPGGCDDEFVVDVTWLPKVKTRKIQAVEFDHA
jgi:hypothetical protein